MKLFCPDCGFAIPASDLELDRLVAKCANCNTVFAFADPATVENRERTPAADRRPIPRPPRFQVQELGGTWRLTYRWFRFVHVGMAVFCVAWDSFLIFWYGIALSSHNTPWIMVVFPIGHLAVGVGLTYAVLTGFLNRTTLELAGGQLTIRHSPLPWPGNRSIPANQIRQLYVTQNPNHGKSNNSQAVRFDLSAGLNNGAKVKLLGGFQDTDGPRYLENELERRLKLPPTRVPGEVEA